MAVKERLLIPLLVLAGCGLPADLGDSVAKGIRAWIAQPFRAPSDAMAPTLIIGDHFFVDKRAFRNREPTRGEVVVFFVSRDATGAVYPRDLRPELPPERFVKRIIAVPGDEIETVEGRPHVNGRPIGFNATAKIYEGSDGLVAEIGEETLGTRHYTVAHARGYDEAPIPRTNVPNGRYFLLGDLRNRSNDSRFWGTVDRDDLIGPVTWIYWSTPPDSYLPRWSRLGEGVD